MSWFPAVAQLLGALASILWPLLGYAFLATIAFVAWLGHARAKAERQAGPVLTIRPTPAADPKPAPEPDGPRQWRQDTLIDLIARAYPYVYDDQWDAHALVILDSRERAIPPKFRNRVTTSTGAKPHGQGSQENQAGRKGQG